MLQRETLKWTESLPERYERLAVATEIASSRESAVHPSTNSDKCHMLTLGMS